MEIMLPVIWCAILFSNDVPASAEEQLAAFEKMRRQVNGTLEFEYRSGFAPIEMVQRIRAQKDVAIQLINEEPRTYLRGDWTSLNGVEHYNLSPSEAVLEQRRRELANQRKTEGVFVVNLPTCWEHILDGEIIVSVQRDSAGAPPTVDYCSYSQAGRRGLRGPYDWSFGRFPLGFTWEGSESRVRPYRLKGKKTIRYIDQQHPVSIIVDLKFGDQPKDVPVYCRTLTIAPGHDTTVCEWYAIKLETTESGESVPVEYLECQWRTTALKITDDILEQDLQVPDPIEPVHAGHFVVKQFKQNAARGIQLSQPTNVISTRAELIRLDSQKQLTYEQIKELTKNVLRKTADPNRDFTEFNAAKRVSLSTIGKSIFNFFQLTL